MCGKPKRPIMNIDEFAFLDAFGVMNSSALNITHLTFA